MSYTLRGRIESRLAAAVPALAVALALHRWWALELVALMLALGLALDLVYHPLIPYQPGWAALPLGAIELGLVYAGMRALSIHAPLGIALALFAVAWTAAQLFGQALFPRLRLSYAESGGELGRAGAPTAAAVAVVLVGSAGFAYATRPPTVHLHGVVRGPLVIRHAETLVGGVVKGGIVVRASHVTLRDVTVDGGSNGIDVESAHDVVLDGVRVVRVTEDGVHARSSIVMIHNCSVGAPAGPWVQGIDISFSMDLGMSMVVGCTITGVREGIVTHSSMVELRDNTIADTTLRGITMGEMSMGLIRGNEVQGALGVGIICLDHSECEIERNTIAGTRPDGGGDVSRAGVAIEAHYYAQATVSENTIVASPGGVGAFDGSTIGR
jgi:hypothetical protein